MKTSLHKIIALLFILPLGSSAAVFTSDALLNPLNFTYDGQDIVVSNATLTVDGAHTFASLLVGPGGTLIHSSSTGGSITITNAIVDEPQVLVGTNDVALAVSNVLSGSVVVKDASGTITYANNTDYVVTIVGAQGFLRRSDTSSIPDGAMVLVSYSATAGSAGAGLTLTLTGSLEVAMGGFINASGRGFGGNVGTGNGGETGSPLSGAGAGYGGYGGNSSSNAIGGLAYGAFQQPVMLGSGGGQGVGGAGGSGGGLVRLTVSNNAVINGTISANGADATNSRSGGGSGGSVWVTAQSIEGAGTITAHGGAGEPIHGGGGGGGRIALYCDTNNYTGATVAYGGNGWNIGGAGTVFLRRTPEPGGLLLVDNGGRAGTNTPVAISGGEDVLIRSNATVLPATTWSAGNVTVLTGAAITADLTGSPPGTGSGAGSSTTSGADRPCSGGGHGGYGAAASTNVNGGNVYGTLATPTTTGSGGGNSPTVSIGEAGGGAMRLGVTGTLWVDGRISANGGNGSGSGGGGGSGGSVYLTATTLAGSGSITANGGDAPLLLGGGGGGGRIATYLTTNLFTGSITAYGGIGANIGGAGTIYSQIDGGVPLVLVDNRGRAGTNTAMSLSGTLDVLVRSNAIAVPATSWSVRYVTIASIASNSLLTVAGPNGTLSVTANRITIDPTGGVVADGAGSGAGSGSGAGGNYAGGGHGGAGGNGATNGFGGLTYDSPTQPTISGSGGGNASNSSNPGGAGGGAIRLNVADDLVVDGRISANGRTSALGGGGAGGSVWLSAGRILGSGLITANGGSCAGPIGGGGGGGRIAIFVFPTTNSFLGSLTAYGGGGVVRGGAGTLYLEGPGPAGPIIRQLILDNGGSFGTNTPLSSLTGTDLIVRNGAIATTASAVSFGNLDVGTNGVLTTVAPSPSLPTFSFGNALVEPGGVVHADGLGGSTSGAGVGSLFSSGIYYCGGGGHGGYGGMGASANARGGNTYDSATSPGTGGSAGGGSGSSFTPFGGAGGGMLRMIVAGSLTNNGRISADGKIGSGTYPGGGSGGSVLLTLGSLYGSGVISANGGPGILPGGGGGGGGRIAITFSSKPYTGIVSAYGGSGVNYGGAGTVYLKTNSANYGQLTVDNGGNAGTNSSIVSSSTADLIVSGRGVAALPSGSSSLHDVLIKTNGTLVAITSTSPQTLTVSGNLTIDPGGVFSLDGTGNGGGIGTGSGYTGTSPRGGAGHGGFGALNPSGLGGAYGSINGPSTPGSGGGNGSGTSAAPFGGAGGGALRLTFNPPGVLTVNGRLSANGKDGDLNSGGGSGGSLWLSPYTLAGSGTISANGGAGNGTAGGGGGGRISISYTSNTFSGTLSASGGSGAVGGGAGTVYTKALAPVAGLLLIDNGGLAGTNTPLSSAYTFPASTFNLTISGGASVFPLTPLPLLSNLNIGAGSLLTMRTNETNIFLATLGDVQIAPGGALVVDGKGYARSAGPGAGASLINKGAGGGYGGLGGNSQSGALGGTNYGSATQPVDRGSGGGAGANAYLGGCEGGGAIRLSVGGTLNVDGSLTANGNPGLQDDSGGGAGGSIWVMARAVRGNGIVSANGGDGDLYGGGGGGGGRIAIYSPSNVFAGLPKVAGGIGANAGQVGTVFFATNFTGFQALSHSPVGVVSNTVSSVDLNFSDAVAVGSVAASDFVLFTPAGALDPASLGASVIGLATVRVSFPPQNLLGDYRLEAGPGILNVFGQPMSQVYTGAFTVLLPTISGLVTNVSGQPVAGVALQPSGGLVAAITDAGGNYSLGVPTDWTGTVTPALGTNMFVPGTLSYTNFAGPVTDQNFLMVPTIAPLLGSGFSGTNLFVNWSGILGVTYQLWSSTNLVDWSPVGGPLPGTNGLMEALVPVDNPPINFLRVRATN